jgi:hypothetical protein
MSITKQAQQSPRIQKKDSRGFARMKNIYENKKEWVKLNSSYIVGTVSATTAAYVSSHIAEKSGMDRSSATTWVAGISAYFGGMTSICACWWLFHRDVYKKNPGKLLNDMLKMAGSTFAAQAITWIVSWSGTAAAVAFGASNFVAVTIQQVLDRLIFIPIFNYMSRKRVKEMENLDRQTEKTQ